MFQVLPAAIQRGSTGRVAVKSVIGSEEVDVTDVFILSAIGYPSLGQAAKRSRGQIGTQFKPCISFRRRPQKQSPHMMWAVDLLQHLFPAILPPTLCLHWPQQRSRHFVPLKLHLQSRLTNFRRFHSAVLRTCNAPVRKCA